MDHTSDDTPSFDSLVELPNSDIHDCFACSPVNPIGLKMRFYSDGQSLYSWATVPDHMGGWGKVAHGGIVSTLLDEIMGWTGIYLLEHITLTKSIRVAFKKALFVNDSLKIKGSVLRRISRREAVLSARVFNSRKELCAASEGIFTLLSPKMAKRLGVMTDDHIRHFFQPLIASKQAAFPELNTHHPVAP